MTPGAYCDGIQHVGIPTDHLENTIHFYEDLGFQVITGASPSGRIVVHS